MGRVRSQVGPIRKKALPKKQDTPLKLSLFRENRLKRQLGTVFEALPEDAELECINFHPFKTTEPQTSKERDPEADKEADSSERDSSPRLYIDTSYSSEDNESFCMDTSSSSSSSSLPSPEVFREDHYVEQCTFHFDVTDVHLPIKNSTLLDLSHAETIHTHQPPNLSTILDPPTILAENSPHKICSNTKPSDGFKVVEDSALETCKKQQTPPIAVQKRILYKKKVWFRSPLFSDKSIRKSITAPKPSGNNFSKQIKPSTPHEPIKPDTKTIKEDKTEVNRAIFFDFASDTEWDCFLQKMKERCSILKNAFLFPSTAVPPKESALL